MEGPSDVAWSFRFLPVLMVSLKLKNFLVPQLDGNENGLGLASGAQRKKNPKSCPVRATLPALKIQALE